jgi:PAS domain-containing protein
MPVAEPHEMPLGVLRLDRDQTVLAADSAFVSLFCCEASTVVGKALDELVSPKDRRASLELAKQMMKGGTAPVDLLATLRIAGRDQLARLRLRARDGGFVAFVEPVGAGGDLLYSLTAIEQRWTGMSRSSLDGILVLDAGGRIIEHNAAFHTLVPLHDARGVKLSEDALLGRPVLDVLGDRFPQLAAYLAAPDGDLVARSVSMLELRASPIALPDRTRIGTFIHVRDIAEELQIEARDAKILADLQKARAFQRAILTVPQSLPNLEIDIAYRPLHEVGGDVFDVAMLDSSRVRIFVADATGHGVQAALATMLIKSTYDAVSDDATGPADVLRRLDDRIASRYRALDVVFTAAVIDIDLTERRVIHASGAHPAPLLVSSRGVRELPAGGTLLGVTPGITFPRAREQLRRR